MANSTTLTTKPCLFYYVHLDQQGFPIPSTMFSKLNNQLDKGLKCREARLTNYQMTVPQGTLRCYGPGNRRYFYLVNSQTNQIVPNSFFSQVGRPRTMCTGVNKVLEYLPNSNNSHNPH